MVQSDGGRSDLHNVHKALLAYSVCIWRCEHSRFCVEGFYALYINFHSFIHSFTLHYRLQLVVVVKVDIDVKKDVINVYPLFCIFMCICFRGSAR